jgi:hypothetical protein
LDGASGAKKWNFATRSFVHSSPAIGVDGTVYVASYDGKLYALDGASGTKEWEFATGTGEVSASPAIGTDGTIYVGSFFGVFYAVQGFGGLAQTPWPKFRGGPPNVGRAVAAPAPPPGLEPVIVYSTYLGGSGHELSPDKDAGNDIAVDAAGNIYVTGASNSRGRYDSDVFVRKFDPSGSRLLYETYFDSNGTDDAGFGIAVDAAGNAYVTGRFGDVWLRRGLGVFAAKLSPAGAPLYQVTFGADSASGFSNDVGVRIAVDATGNAYVVGTTFAPLEQPFPTTSGAFQRTHGGGLTDVFVVKLNQSGDFVYSTLLGGAEFDRGWGIAVNAAGNAYVVGDSQGDFPTTPGVMQRTLGGGSDAFVTELNPSGSALVYSTYLGGTGTDEGLAIALDSSGNVHLTGSTVELLTTTNDFPLVNPFQPAYGGARANAFVAKLNSSGSALLYSSYMGGRGSNLEDVGVAIKVDEAGYAYLTGSTETFPDVISGTRFPIVNAFQPTHGGGVSDAFVVKLTPQGALVYSSYLGGSGGDNANGIALGASGTVYVTGTTSSQDFPTTKAFQPKPGGGRFCELGECFDAFVTIVTEPSGLLSGLMIKLEGTTAVISWLGTGAEFILETTGNLSSPVRWTPEPTLAIDVGAEKRVTVPLAGPARFYRLKKL